MCSTDAAGSYLTADSSLTHLDHTIYYSTAELVLWLSCRPYFHTEGTRSPDVVKWVPYDTTVHNLSCAVCLCCLGCIEDKELSYASVLYTMACLTLKHTAPHMCYHAEFGRSASKGVVINRRKSPNGEALGPAPFRWGVSDSVEIRPVLHVLPC